MTPSPSDVTGGYPGLRSCPVCGTAPELSVFVADDVPLLCNVQYATPEEARAAETGAIDLAQCRSCGLLWNSSYESDRVAYSPAYENSLHFSPRFQRFAEELAADLVARHGLAGATVLEIGSGKGDFLALLCDAGAGRGIGYDPSYAGDTPGRPDLRFVPSLFPDKAFPDADLVCARHVFEHLDQPARVLANVVAAIPPGRSVRFYAEVPDGGHLLREVALWDVIYEHPLHFTARALIRLFADAGLRVTRVSWPFAGQYLAVEASTEDGSATATPADPSDDAAHAGSFGRRAADLHRRWAQRLDTLLGDGPVALWGAGSKGVSFLTTVPGGERVTAVVDINPRKHGRHVPVTAQPIVAPGALAALRPRAVVLLNAVYRDEVAEMMRDAEVDAELVTEPS